MSSINTGTLNLHEQTWIKLFLLFTKWFLGSVPRENIVLLYCDTKCTYCKLWALFLTILFWDMLESIFIVLVWISPVWPPHTPERSATHTEGALSRMVRAGSLSSAPQQRGRGNQSRRRCSSRTSPEGRWIDPSPASSSSEDANETSEIGHWWHKERTRLFSEVFSL